MHPAPGLAGALEALRLAEAEPAAAVTMAAELAGRARRSGDREVEAVAERAWGLALRHRGDLGSAITHLVRAVRIASATGAAGVAGEARITLAFALSERGRARDALAQIDRAVDELDGAAHARARAQRGTILLELGRHTEAIAAYREALPLLRAVGDTVWAWRVVSNRGLAHAYRHQFAAAEADLRHAERLAVELDLPLQVGFQRANLAFVLGLRGEVMQALDYSARAEKLIRSHEAQVGEVLKDRAELLLSMRLVPEAREAAEQALVEYQREQRRIKVPQVELLLAEAALLDGDSDAGLRHATRAGREFARQERAQWAAVARVTALRGGLQGGRIPRGGVQAAEDAVGILSRAGWPAAAMEARLIAARLQRAKGRPDLALPHLDEAARTRRSGTAMLRARGWYAAALSRLAGGRRAAAYGAVRAGLGVLDTHRAVIAATDVRAHAARHRHELADLGLRLAMEDGSPRRVLEWAERARAGELLVHKPGRPPDDPELAQVLAELRGTVMHLREVAAGPGGTAVGPIRQRQGVLERQARDLLRRRGPEGTARHVTPPPIAELIEGLGHAGLLELAVQDSKVVAVTVAGGRVRMRRLGPLDAISRLIDQVVFAQRRLTRRSMDAASQEAMWGLLRDASSRLDQLLVRSAPELSHLPLVIVPTGPLQSLPWAALPSCRTRPITVAPSAALWLAARSRVAPHPHRVVVLAGPNLPGADAEARAVGEAHGVVPMLPPESTVRTSLDTMSGAALVHVAAHGRLAAHNPLFSDLMLSDGPLFAYDIERLDRAPHTVVLAACDSGRSVVCDGDALLGLSAAFMAAGTSQLVAAVLPVPDIQTMPVMLDFHRFAASGLPAAEALAGARALAAGDPAAEVAAACFVCFGDGFAPARAATAPDAGSAGPGRAAVRLRGIGGDVPVAVGGPVA